MHAVTPSPFRRPARRLRAAFALAALGLSGLAASAQAHGIWFAERARNIALIYGVGADDLDMVKRLPLLDPPTAWSADWQPVPVTIKPAGIVPIVEAAGPWVAVAASMDYGMWTKKADGEFVNKGKDEVPGPVLLAERTKKYAVFLKTLNLGNVPAIAGHEVQLVPVGPLPSERGKVATFRVLAGGKPAAGAEIITDFVNDPDMKRLRTRADGTIRFPVRNQGLNIVAAVVVTKSDQPAKYDRIEHTATLGFVLPHEEE